MATNLNQHLKIQLQLQAAKYKLGTLNSEDIPLMINQLLDEGIYFDEFLTILDSDQKIHADLDTAFEKSLSCLGIDLPPNEENAVYFIIQYYVQQIINEENDSLAALISMKKEIYYFLHHDKEYVGDSYGIQTLMGSYWEYDEMTETPRTIYFDEIKWNEKIKLLKKESMIEAKKWLEKN